MCCIALGNQAEDGSLADRCAAVLGEFRGRMAELDVKFVNVISYVPPNLPHYYTFTAGVIARRSTRGERPQCFLLVVT